MLQSLRSSKIKNFDVQICLRFRVDAVDNPRDTDDGREWVDVVQQMHND